MNNLTREEIIEKIEAIKDKGTQTNPEYFLDLIKDIMRYGGLDETEIKRFLTYFK